MPDWRSWGPVDVGVEGIKKKGGGGKGSLKKRESLNYKN